MDVIEVGMHVSIQRSDGRVQEAEVSQLKQDGQTVLVEWLEAGEIKGKEIKVTDIRAIPKGKDSFTLVHALQDDNEEYEMLFTPVNNIQVATTPTVERNSTQPVMEGSHGAHPSVTSQSQRDGRKRVHMDHSDITVMILVPICAVGSVIGKGGSALRVLKKDYHCYIEISKKSYAGTNDRVCLMRGRYGNVVGMIKVILEQVRETCSAVDLDDYNLTGEYRCDECKMIVPTASAGMLVMHAKNIRKLVGCQLQLYQTFAPPHSQERIVTVAHEQNNKIIEALQKVLEVVVFHENDMRTIIENHFGVQKGWQADVSKISSEVMRRRSGASSNANNVAAEVIKEDAGGDFIDLKIPESWIGCVLGPQLKTLEAIRFYSGCKIDVFKNGAVANIPADIRVIRICGCGDNTKVQLAKAIVERIINETHENRRARSCSSFLPSEAP